MTTLVTTLNINPLIAFNLISRCLFSIFRYSLVLVSPLKITNHLRLRRIFMLISLGKFNMEIKIIPKACPNSCNNITMLENANPTSIETQNITNSKAETPENKLNSQLEVASINNDYTPHYFSEKAFIALMMLDAILLIIAYILLKFNIFEVIATISVTIGCLLTAILAAIHLTIAAKISRDSKDIRGY